jgi:hypothetical protein
VKSVELLNKMGQADVKMQGNNIMGISPEIKSYWIRRNRESWNKINGIEEPTGCLQALMEICE